MPFFRVVKFQSVGRHPRPLHSVNLPLHQMYGVTELSCGKWCRSERGHTGTWAIKMYVLMMFDILMRLHFVSHQIFLSIESKILYKLCPLSVVDSYFCYGQYGKCLQILRYSYSSKVWGQYVLIFLVVEEINDLYSILCNVSWAANQHIKMVSEGSCDTEYWRNDVENSALNHWNKYNVLLIFK